MRHIEEFIINNHNKKCKLKYALIRQSQYYNNNIYTYILLCLVYTLKHKYNIILQYCICSNKMCYNLNFFFFVSIVYNTILVIEDEKKNLTGIRRSLQDDETWNIAQLISLLYYYHYNIILVKNILYYNKIW